MAELTRYIVCDDPDEWGDGPVFEGYMAAKAMAQQAGACVVELTYEYSDSELVDDFRPTTLIETLAACPECGTEIPEDEDTGTCPKCWGPTAASIIANAKRPDDDPDYGEGDTDTEEDRRFAARIESDDRAEGILKQDRYFADLYDADNAYFVFDSGLGGAEVSGPFPTFEQAVQKADELNGKEN